MHISYKKIIPILSFCFCLKNSHSHADVVNPVDQEPPIAHELIFQNRSILKCGSGQDETVLTLLDVQALLSISNLIIEHPVKITTDWSNFDAPKINLYKLSAQIPQDVLRILFLCLNWQDAKLANLFVTADAELQNRLRQMKQEQPWKIYPAETQTKINHLSDAYLKELIDIVLRAKLALPVRGDLKTNNSLKSVKFVWLL